MASPRICVVITAGDIDGAVDAIQSVLTNGPDLIEVRLDYMKSTDDLNRIRDATSLPLIATNRRRDQGGLHVGSEAERIETLLEASERGFDYVDLELNTGSLVDIGNRVKANGSGLIVSHHDFATTPERGDLEDIMLKELKMGADLCKVIGTSRTHRDNLTYLNFLDENLGVDLVCFGMGEAGVISRILSPLFGGEFTYASTKTGSESALGQLTVAEFREIYRIMGV